MSFLFAKLLLQHFIVHGPSMEPNFYHKQLVVIINKIIYLNPDKKAKMFLISFLKSSFYRLTGISTKPHRGDAIIFKIQSDSLQIRNESQKELKSIGKKAVIKKRMLQTQLLKRNRTKKENCLSEFDIYIKRIIGLPEEKVEIFNGTVYINNKPLKENYIIRKLDDYCAQITVPKGAFFVMGDNRIASSDSRNFGFINFENVIGKAVFNYWPFDNEWGLVQKVKYN